MTQKTGKKWKTKRCGRCQQIHYGYSGKLDKDRNEYVVCGKTNKKMLINGNGPLLFVTEWIEVIKE